MEHEKIVGGTVRMDGCRDCTFDSITLIGDGHIIHQTNSVGTKVGQATQITAPAVRALVPQPATQPAKQSSLKSFLLASGAGFLGNVASGWWTKAGG